MLLSLSGEPLFYPTALTLTLNPDPFQKGQMPKQQTLNPFLWDLPGRIVSSGSICLLLMLNVTANEL